MTSILTFLMSGILFGALSLHAIEKKWYPGAFPEDGTSKVSTLSEVKKVDDNIIRYTYRFKTDKSGQAEVQFPIDAGNHGDTAVIIEIKGIESSPNLELWLKDIKGSKFQGRIQTVKGKWKSFKFPLQDCSAADVRSVQLVIPNKNNANNGEVELRMPQWGTAPRKWYSGSFEDADGKSKTSSVKISSDENGHLTAVFSFPDKNSGPAFVQTPLNGESGMWELSIAAAADSPVREFEIWAETSKGWTFQGKISVTTKELSTYILPLKETLSQDIKFIRILVANPGNPGFTLKTGSLKLMAQDRTEKTK